MPESTYPHAAEVHRYPSLNNHGELTTRGELTTALAPLGRYDFDAPTSCPVRPLGGYAPKIKAASAAISARRLRTCSLGTAWIQGQPILGLGYIHLGVELRYVRRVLAITTPRRELDAWPFEVGD